MPDEPADRAACEPETPAARPGWVWVRRAALAAWVAALVSFIVVAGVPVDRKSVLIWIVLGLAAGSIGRRGVGVVLLDFAPLFALLLLYNYLYGIADGLGMPAHWHAQLEVEKFLFFGNVPSFWLQEHLKYATPQWWEAPISLVYLSYFVLPVITAGLLWLRSRRDFYRWSGRFIALVLLSFTCFALIPTAPPWAAARCTSAQVANHPADPPCLHQSPRLTHGGLLGKMDVAHEGATPYVQRISVARAGGDALPSRRRPARHRPGRLRPGGRGPVAALGRRAAVHDLHVASRTAAVARRCWCSTRSR